MSLVQTKDWKILKRYINIEDYKREGGNKNPRFRLRVSQKIPKDILEKVLQIKIPCAVCGESIHPVRARANLKNAYVAVTCPLTTNIGCSRSHQASEEYKVIREALSS